MRLTFETARVMREGSRGMFAKLYLPVIVLCAAPLFADEPLRIVTWNLDSGGNDPQVIAQQLQALRGYHVYGLTEVDPANAMTYAQAVGNQYRAKISQTGDRDRLLMLYDTSRLTLLSAGELAAFQDLRLNDQRLRYRSPLLVRFRDQPTQVELLVVLNHLVRDDPKFRREQAKALRLWCEDQEDQAVIGIGDYNFDFDGNTLRGNTAFDEFMLDYRWRFVRPHPFADTHWSDRDDDGRDDLPDSLSDLTFLGGRALNWLAKSRVIVTDGDLPDDRQTSSHRPVELIVTPRN